MQTTDVTRTWDSREALARCTGKGISVGDEDVRLQKGVTVADEMGRNNRRDREAIAGLRQAKKVFHLPALGAGRALLCPYLTCDCDDGELEVVVNGHPLTVRAREDRPYWEDRWTPIEVPVDHLVAGDNEVVFRSAGDGAWALLVEPGRWPDRSQVSEDGGVTWRSDDLGENDRTDGEYMVRLWLDQFAGSGELCSEPVDLFCLAGDAGIAPRGRVDVLRFETRVSKPPGTQVSLAWRGGPTPAYEPDAWSAWAPAQGEVRPDETVRFLQWRATLTTADPALTPELSSVTVGAELEIAGAPSVRVAEADNADLVRSSYRFATLPADAERGKLLRERWKLDEVVRGAKTDMDAFLRLRQWVREQWEDGWNMGGIDFCPPWDAMVILELASRNLSLGMCTHYATVMSQCCAALGLVARTQIMRCHCINEVWSGEDGKWVAMDVGGDTDDETKFTYHFERNGVPLSALEAHQAWVDDDYDDVVIAPSPPAATKDRFEVAKRLELFERFMISLRNDELVSMSPGEPEHGKISYHYDGYLFWRDGKTEPLPWFSNHTDREADLYWSVNRAKIHLLDGERADLLEVLLETDTPNLAGFSVRTDDDEWEERGATFEWPLHVGPNRLEVRPVNAFGRPGACSWVAVNCEE